MKYNVLIYVCGLKYCGVSVCSFKQAMVEVKKHKYLDCTYRVVEIER